MENNNLKAIDTHAHLYLCKNNLQDIIDFAQEQGVAKIVNVGINLQTSFEAAKIAEKYKGIVFATIGIHPSEEDLSQISRMEEEITKYSYVAIGEIGLDYYHMTNSKEEQKKVFLTQLYLARKYKLPVIIHNRDADEDTKEMLQDFKDLKKVFHCYSADWDFAQNFLDQVTYFSFTGSITYAKKGRVINTIRNLPLEKIMIETDCPYLTPSDYRGQENQPGFVLKVAQKVAEVKACTLSEVLEKTTRNAREFFQI